MRVPIEKTPQDLRRRAARHLESVRGTPMAPGTEGATLGPEACPLYRPDIKGVAYWEFEIVGVKPPAGDVKGPRTGGRGSIVVTAGTHDVPIPHWSTEMDSPSRALEAQVKAPAVVARVYKIDALCYAAEDAKGAYLAHLGQFPPQVQLPAIDPAAPREPSGVVAGPAKAGVAPLPSDEKPGKLTLTTTGSKVVQPKVVPWKTWAGAKKGYAASYKVHLQALQQRAATAWQVEALVKQFGEGIHAGTSLTVPLLKPGKATIVGDGAKLVKLATLKQKAPAVQLTALDLPGTGEVNFELQIAYADGTKEALAFFVVPAGSPSRSRTVHPQPIPIHPNPILPPNPVLPPR